MHRQLFFLVATVLLGHALAVLGQAQLIQVRPGYVRAPFVRVYTNPDGSSHVRAPFVDINSPGYRRPQYVAPGSQMAVHEPVDEMDEQSLTLAVLESVARLDVDLGELPTGDFWRSYLKIDAIHRIMANHGANAFAARNQQLQPIVAIYDATSESVEMQQIANLPSFHALHAELRELLTPPERRLHRQLKSAFQQLSDALQSHEAAKTWRNYLALPSAMSSSQDSDAPSMIELAVVLSRYDSVSRSMQYREIAELAGFEMTHRRLAEYYQMLDPPIGTSAIVDELPPPIPVPPMP